MKHMEFKAIAISGPDDVTKLNVLGENGWELVAVTLADIAWLQRPIPDWEWNERHADPKAIDTGDDLKEGEAVVTDEGKLCKVTAVKYDGAIPLYDLIAIGSDVEAAGDPPTFEDVPGEFLRRAGPDDVIEQPVIVKPTAAADGAEVPTA